MPILSLNSIVETIAVHLSREVSYENRSGVPFYLPRMAVWRYVESAPKFLEGADFKEWFKDNNKMTWVEAIPYLALDFLIENYPPLFIKWLHGSEKGKGRKRFIKGDQSVCNRIKEWREEWDKERNTLKRTKKRPLRRKSECT